MLRVFAFLFTYVLFTTNSFACSCASSTLIDDWNEYKHIFLAEVTEIKAIAQVDENSNGLSHGYIKVLDIYKGEPNNNFYIESSLESRCCDCSTTLHKGKYIVYSNSEKYTYRSLCSSTKSVGTFNPYETKALKLLKDKTPTINYKGVYNQRSKSLTFENGKSIKIVGLEHNSLSVISYVDIEVYNIDRKHAYLAIVNSVTPMGNAKHTYPPFTNK